MLLVMAKILHRLLAGLVALAIAILAPHAPSDPGALPQTSALPSTATAQFKTRAGALWRGIVSDSVSAALPAFFPRRAYLQVKQLSDPGADYDHRLLAAYQADIAAAHALLGAQAGRARLLYVSLPAQWAWITPGVCANRVGYWHEPGARLVYRVDGSTRSLGISSFISWRGQWYVVHLAPYDQPGTVVDPSAGVGSYGQPGGC